MYIENQTYLLKARKGSYIDGCVTRLGPSILLDNILTPILNIKNVRNDKNISFIPGNININIIKEKINNKEFNIAFILKTISIHEIKDVANHNQHMPPKSTYIEPKLRSGLTIYTF